MAALGHTPPNRDGVPSAPTDVYPSVSPLRRAHPEGQTHECHVPEAARVSRACWYLGLVLVRDVYVIESGTA